MPVMKLIQITAVLTLLCTVANHVEASGMELLEEEIVMPVPASDSGNTYARGMSAILSHLGPDISYDQVMGLSGVAFILQVDTSGPVLPGGELDCAWWPNDAWGFDLGLPVLSQAVGWEIRKLRCDGQAYREAPAGEYHRRLEPAVTASLRAGRPVLAESVHGFIATRVDDQEPALLGYGTRGKSTQFVQDIIRIGRHPWGAYVIGDQIAKVDPRATDVASLHHIIALFNEQAQGSETPTTRYSGRQAWAEWLGLLQRAMADGDNSNCGSAWDNNMLTHLRYNRRSAVAYLRGMAQRHTGHTAAHLVAAADLYQHVLDDLMKGEMPHPGPTKGGLSAYAAMVERVSKLEAEAITRLEAAISDKK